VEKSNSDLDQPGINNLRTVTPWEEAGEKKAEQNGQQRNIQDEGLLRRP